MVKIMLLKIKNINAAIKKTFIAILVMNSSYVQSAFISFEHINIIPMNEDIVLINQRVIVEDTKIIAIESAEKKSSFKIDRTVDVTGKFMMPGLSETHYHQTSNANEEYKLLIANGVTSVRSMAEFDKREGADQDAIATRNHANKVDVLAPHYYTTGPMLDKSNLTSVKDAIEMVKFHQQRGYDFIKVHDNFPLDVYLTLLEEAEKASIPVVGHAQREMDLNFSLRLTSLAHVEEFMNLYSKDELADDVFLAKIAKQVKDSGVYVSPTLTTFALITHYANDDRFKKLKQRKETSYLANNIIQEWASDNNSYRKNEWFTAPKSIIRLDNELKLLQRLTLAFHQAGVPLMVGTDTYGLQVPGFSMHDEIALMVDAGIPNYDVLKAATLTSARYLKRSASAGSIDIGKNAEFVILAGNPLIDIKQTKNIEGVMLKGKWLNRTDLDTLLKQVITTRQEEIKL
jgi:imidazolonepropionase-like amidohydrolase